MHKQKMAAATGQMQHLLRRTVAGVQNGLIRNVVGAAAQISTGSQVNQLEPLLAFCKDDVHGLDIPVHKACCM